LNFRVAFALTFLRFDLPTILPFFILCGEEKYQPGRTSSERPDRRRWRVRQQAKADLILQAGKSLLEQGFSSKERILI
jgi:hypothetical protein